MKLYYAPGTCALAPHIVAREAGVDLTLERVDLKAKTTASGRNYLDVSPKGYVPALELDSGDILTEGPAISLYIADRKPHTALAPPEGTLQRYQVLSLMSYISSELHKNYSLLFNPTTAAQTREDRMRYLERRYGYIERQLEGKSFLCGERFGIADAFLYTVTRWAGKFGLNLTPMPNLVGLQNRIAERPAVRAALAEEGLR